MFESPKKDGLLLLSKIFVDKMKSQVRILVTIYSKLFKVLIAQLSVSQAFP